MRQREETDLEDAAMGDYKDGCDLFREERAIDGHICLQKFNNFFFL